MDKLIKYFRVVCFSLQDIQEIEEIINSKITNTDPDNVKNKLLEFIKTEIEIPESISTIKKEEPTIDEIRYMTNKTAANLIKNESTIKKYITLNDSPKTILMYNQLNDSQKTSFDKLHEFLSSSLNIDTLEIDNPNIILMDAAGGTGKSFLIECLAQSLTWNIKLIVKTRKLANSFKEIKNLNTCTTCKFIMDTFNCKFNDAIKLFDDLTPVEEMIKKIHIILNSSIKLNELKLLIIDEYSLESPILLIILSILSIRYKFNILIMGDQKQQNTIQKTLYYNHSNYDLLKSLNIVKFLNLDVQMRITDLKYLEIINMLREKINSMNKIGGEVTLQFDSKYLIFKNFKYYFIKLENKLENIYVTDTHQKLKVRLEELEKYAIDKHMKTKREPYIALCLITQKRVNLLLPSEYKFPNYLLLVENMYYSYTYMGKDTRVKIKSIHDDYLCVVINETQTEVIIKKCIWTMNDHSCVDEQFEWMSSFTENDIVQYPIRPLLYTFHAIQGLTFNTEMLSFDLDAKSLNSIYVALSRVRSMDQLGVIKTSDILGFLYTDYKNDEYYYKIKSKNKNISKNLCTYLGVKTHTFDTKEFDDTIKTVDTIKLFEKGYFANARILKSKYIALKREIAEESILLYLYRFYSTNIEETLIASIDGSQLLQLFTNYTINIQKELEVERPIKRPRIEY